MIYGIKGGKLCSIIMLRRELREFYDYGVGTLYRIRERQGLFFSEVWGDQK